MYGHWIAPCADFRRTASLTVRLDSTANQQSSVKRPYQSTLRQRQSQSTRLSIIEAAARLFIAQGYVATSMDEIATAAGVGRATVFASVGGKAAILKAAYDIAIVGDDEPIPLPQRSWAIAVRNEPDPGRMIDRYAAMITEICGRVAPIYEAREVRPRPTPKHEHSGTLCARSVEGALQALSASSSLAMRCARASIARWQATSSGRSSILVFTTYWSSIWDGLLPSFRRGWEKR